MTQRLKIPLEAAVTVVTYNSAADIERCICSLATHFSLLREGLAEVHVVDNASRDGTPSIVARLATVYPWLKLHEPGKNLGFGAGNNLVLRTVEARARVLLNADAWLVADSFSPAVNHIVANPKTGVIGLPLVYPDGGPQTYAFLPSAWHRWLLVILGARSIAKHLVKIAPAGALMRRLPFARNFALNHGKPKLDLTDEEALMASATGEVRPADWVAGAAMVVSPELVAASGGFDPEIFLYGEDEDLCIQAHRLGFAVETLGTVPIVHKLGWDGDGGFRPIVAKMKYDSLSYFITKNITGGVNRAMMRALLPMYVYGRNIGQFLRKES